MMLLLGLVLTSLAQLLVQAEVCTLNVDKDYVQNKIKYSCLVVQSSVTPIYVPVACQVSNTLVLTPTNPTGTDGTFNYECRKPDPLTMQLDVTGCKRPDKVTNMNIGETYESQFNGVFRCVRSDNDSVIYHHVPVCVRPDHEYRNVSEEWVDDGVQLKCFFQNSQYRAKAIGCVFVSSTGVETKAKINETVKISDNNFQKCLANSSDDTQASFSLIDDSTCEDGNQTYELLKTWGTGDIAYKCSEVDMKATKVEIGCWIENSFALAYGGSVKLSGVWYYCDRGQKKGVLIANADCDNNTLHELGKTWIEGDTKFTCIYSSALGGVTRSATDCVVGTSTMVPKGKIVQLTGSDGVKYGYKCEIVSSTDLNGRRLTNEEYKQWKTENGIDDDDNTADGGKGTANPESTSHQPTTPLATQAPTNPPTPKPTTQAPINPTEKPTTPHSASTKVNNTNVPVTAPPSTPKPGCEDKSSICRLLSDVCNNKQKKKSTSSEECDSDEDYKHSKKGLSKFLGITKNNNKKNSGKGGESSRSDDSKKKHSKENKKEDKHQGKHSDGSSSEEKHENKNKGKSNKSQEKNEHGKHQGKYSQENTKKGKNNGKHTGKASSEESKKHSKNGHSKHSNSKSSEENGKHGGNKYAAEYVKYVQLLCPRTCNLCGKSKT